MILEIGILFMIECQTKEEAEALYEILKEEFGE